MNDIVESKPTIPDETNEALVTDLTRFSEGVYSEQYVRSRHKLDDAAWTALAANDKLVEAIAERRIQRRQSGATKRERAQGYVEDAPEILNAIMKNTEASPRHRNDAIKTLNALATEGQQGAAGTGEIFRIQINLGNETKIYEQRIKPIEPVINGETTLITDKRDADDLRETD